MKHAPRPRRVQAPRIRRPPTAKLDHVAIIPASELHALDTWQKLAQRLPAGETLLVIPGSSATLHAVGRRIRHHANQRGHRITIMTTGALYHAEGSHQRHGD